MKNVADRASHFFHRFCRRWYSASLYSDLYNVGQLTRHGESDVNLAAASEATGYANVRLIQADEKPLRAGKDDLGTGTADAGSN